MKRQRIKAEYIHVPENRRRKTVDAKTVSAIAASIKEVGLRSPISVYFKDDVLIDGELVDNVAVLVTGAHRREALIRLGGEFAWTDCDVFEDEYAASLWEISENLHRSDLSVDERAEHRDAWIRLRSSRTVILGQVDPKLKSEDNPKGAGRSEGGIRLAVREMPKLDGKSDEAKRSQLRRDLLIASRTDEAKEVCRELGLADNQSALIEVSKAEPEWVKNPDRENGELQVRAAAAQVAKAREIAARKSANSEAPPVDRKASQRQKFWDMWASLDDDVREELHSKLAAMRKAA